MIASLITLLFCAPLAEDRPAPSLPTLVEDQAPLILEVRDGSALLDTLMGSDLYKRIEALPEWQAALEGKEARQALSAARLFTGMLELSLEEAAHELLGRQFWVALRPGPGERPGALLMTRLQDPTMATRLDEVVHQFLTLVAQGDEYDDKSPARTVNGKEFHAVLGDCFLLSNDRELIRTALDRGRQAAADRAGRSDRPIPSRQAPGIGQAELQVDLVRMREALGGATLPTVLDNALASLLGHGLLVAANESKQAVASLSGSEKGLVIDVSLDGAAAAVPSGMEWFFPEQPQGIRFTPPPATIAALELVRSFDGFYADRFTLLDPSLENGLVEFDNIISIFFGGRPFGAEVLPALGPQARLLVSSQTFADLPTAPEIRMPAFTLVAPLDTKMLGRNDMLIAFQTTVGLINADRAQKGLESLMMNTERYGGIDVASARYLLDEDEVAQLRHNMQPCMAVVQDNLVLGSSRESVLAIVDSIRDSKEAVALQLNSLLQIDFPDLVTILDQNRSSLIANRMLEEGESREQAGLFWDRALDLLGLLDSGEVRVSRDQAGVHLTLEVTPAAPSQRPAGQDGEAAR